MQSSTFRLFHGFGKEAFGTLTCLEKTGLTHPIAGLASGVAARLHRFLERKCAPRRRFVRNILAVAVALVLVLLVGPANVRADGFIVFGDIPGKRSFNNNGFVGFCGNPETCMVPLGVSFSSVSINLLFNIYEPDSVTLSDTLAITSPGVGDVNFTWVSDLGGTPPIPLVGGTTIIENGTIQTLGTIPFTGGVGPGGRSIEFISFEPVSTPEPSSLQLLGIGLLALTAVTLRKQLA